MTLWACGRVRIWARVSLMSKLGPFYHLACSWSTVTLWSLHRHLHAGLPRGLRPEGGTPLLVNTGGRPSALAQPGSEWGAGALSPPGTCPTLNNPERTLAGRSPLEHCVSMGG